MNTKHDMNLTFIFSKRFDVYTADGLQDALNWLESTDADSLMYGRRV